ncbi:MAG: tetratricopeptide repeat protein [Pseudomonadota bacterium]
MPLRLSRANGFWHLALVPLALAAAFSFAIKANAQTMTSQPVVQPLPSQDTQRLNQALVKLAKAPRSLPALLEAGDAALSVQDLDAALGFFTRALEVEPDNRSATLGLAKVYLRSGRPVTALPLFNAAEGAGAGLRAIRSDKALALDMVGDQAGAQEGYARVVEASPKDDPARRRLAISYAISGNRAGFETVLRPLIDRRDFAAFRARAFGLAIMGEQDRAAAITEAVMPRELADKITPYLEFMPRLTPAQQAAAANLGIFPRAADIGRDPPEILAYRNGAAQASPTLARASETSPGSLLEPVGQPLGAEAPALEPQVAASNVADAFGDIAGGAEPARVLAADAGAVDLTTFEAPIEPKIESPPKPPAHPSRIWVQLATGRDVKALGFDWRRFVRKAPDLLDDYDPHTVPWGQANRLLAGPLESRDDARALINALKKKGIDTFRYTSPEGSVIQSLKVP